MLGKLLKLLGGSVNVTYQTIRSGELQEILKNDQRVQLLDVRSPGEFQSGHIPKARNINVMTPKFKNQLQGLDKSKTYYVYCRSGMRSTKACKIMAKEGFEQVYNLKGGIMGWGGKVV
ncbi:rhodanese-like domain-containing protein [uncultured Microscilla sp.]|uniref:rhodanese-like domain-containing protein n=1 Tax=uncultured Microscilla sp. TaxID=432653 RepID=UPI002624FBF2|nr:rhodanese-like domain-containing protein [uncultured Microscilla sp.]